MTTREFLKTVTQSALGWGSSVEATYDICRLAIERGISGDFVECGVYAGAQSAAMARAILDLEWPDKTDRIVHLYDTFDGIPPAGEHDTDFHKQPSEACRCSFSDTMDNLFSWDIPGQLFEMHEGLFENTVPHHPASKRIAVLRLDGDLYESTKVCLESLMPLVSPGGWVIVDDYNLSGCRKAVEEYTKNSHAPIMWRVPLANPWGQQ